MPSLTVEGTGIFYLPRQAPFAFLDYLGQSVAFFRILNEFLSLLLFVPFLKDNVFKHFNVTCEMQSLKEGKHIHAQLSKYLTATQWKNKVEMDFL